MNKQDRINPINADLARTFDTPHGERVLDYLEWKISQDVKFDSPESINPNAALWREAQRDQIRMIRSKLKNLKTQQKPLEG